MIIRALLPKLKPKTVKEKIIFILSSDFPLTVKDLRLRIKSQFHDSVSYQSVHKELNRLKEEDIVKLESKKYLLNVEWIKQVGLFSDLIISNYTRQKRHSINKLLELKQDGDTISFEFKSYAEFDMYFLELLDYFNEFFGSDKKILMHYTHNWWPLVYPLREKQVVKKLKSRFYCLCRSNSKIDQYCSRFERKIGMEVLYTKDSKLHWNVNVMGDLIVTFYSDREIHNAVGKFFEKHKDLSHLDLDELLEILQRKGRFRVVVIKDSKFAETVLEETKLFNKKVKK